MAKSNIPQLDSSRAFTCKATNTTERTCYRSSVISLDTIYYQILSRDRKWSKCHFRMDDNYEPRYRAGPALASVNQT